MKPKLINVSEALRTSLWFLPSLTVTATIALSFVTIASDLAFRDKLVEKLKWIWAAGPEGARLLLSTIAGSMITVAGVVFSITIVALTLASSVWPAPAAEFHAR